MEIKADDRRRWGPEQRLEFIEFRLFWDGGVRRGDLISRFNVSTPQASTDLANYRELAPENMEYDATQKRYVATAAFAPRFLKPNADRYLVQLKAIADGVIRLDETPIIAPPNVDALPIPHRRVEPRILKVLLEAIRNQRGLSVHYHSMNPKRPDAQWRSITPHAFANDGLRWHIRAFCHEDRRFKDFILSRFLDIGQQEPAGAKAATDTDWFSTFDVVLVPNPRLSEGQQRMIAFDYDMPDGQLTLPVRCALLYYFNKRLRLDVAPAVDEPKETPVVVLNKKEFDQAMKRLG
jgi:predicted DNA-binding transcriptional regulator YafY